MKQNQDFTAGPLFLPLVRFILPILGALSLQFLYGAIDLAVVGKYALPGDIAGVAIGSQIMQTITSMITGLAVGITVQVGQALGKQRPDEASRTIGSGIFFFFLFSLLVTGFMFVGHGSIIRIMDTPTEALTQTTAYVCICSSGTVFIAAYNLLGGIFRGIGDSKMPLITVAIASFINLLGDLLFVACLGYGAAGAAAATVLAQALSVILSLTIILRRKLPFPFSLRYICPDRAITARLLRLGVPVALQNTLLNISFLISRTFVNAMGVIASSGVGVSSKLSYIIMLIPEAYMHGLSSFAAQNIGAGRMDRARRALLYGIISSFAVSIPMFLISYFNGSVLVSLFAKDSAIIAAGTQYFRAAAIDCLLTAFSFCFIGYFNGCGMTKFVLFQGLVAAFFVRIPVAYYFSHLPAPQLFHIGLACPVATAVQIILHLLALSWQKRQAKKNGTCS